jgi:starch phosphorylase
VQTRWPSEPERMDRMSIIEEGPRKQIRMAHLATVGAHSINGVAKLHSRLIESLLLRDFHELWPERFNNKTNGVTPRRWILNANPGLTRVISARIGTSWIDSDLSGLKALMEYVDADSLLEDLQQVKRENKLELIRLVQKRCGVDLPPEAMFISQVKRIHEYKRQLLACLHIVAHYIKLKRSEHSDEVPRAYIFAGKAAPGYSMAKLHIRLLNDVASVINADPMMRGRLAMAFVPNYGVSLAETIIPASEVSLQISTAGTEASGTSNMKLALNGALTIGTLDGANVEIRDEVGPENFFLFGLTTPEVAALRLEGYDPMRYINQSPALAEAIELIASGFFSLGDKDRFKAIVDNLRFNDHYMLCADFDAYVGAQELAARVYRDQRDWSRRSLFNIIGASAFSSDNTIRQYAREIWHIQPVKTDLSSVSLGAERLQPESSIHGREG